MIVNTLRAIFLFVFSNIWRFHSFLNFYNKYLFPIFQFKCFNIELWKKQRKLNLFVQHTCQGDGERTAEIEPQMIYVLEANTNTKK